MEEFTLGTIIVICLSVLFTGIAKAGIPGASSVIIPILAIFLGGKISVGFLLPISFVASLLSGIRNRSHINWKSLIKVLPWALTGIFVGAWVGDRSNERIFFILLSTVILVGAAITIIQHLKHSAFRDPYGISVVAIGLIAGFSAMIGNATGPLISTLFLLQRFPKKQFIHTYVWFCLITDFIKIPFHVFLWHTITLDSLLLGLYTIPIMVIGVFIGFWLTKVLSIRVYQNTIITLSCITAIFLLIY